MRVLHLGRRRPGEASRARPHARIRREAVDVVAGEAGVRNGHLRRLDGQVEVAAPEPPPDVGLADARDDRPAFQGLFARSQRAHESSAGVKRGTHTSSTCSKTTRTGMPMRTSSGSTSMRLVVSRTSGCSSMETQAMM